MSNRDEPESAVAAFLGLRTVSFRIAARENLQGGLDASQRRALATALHPENEVTLVQGPPGTGKTTVLECLLRELCSERRRILVAAPSNAAVDNVCRRIRRDLPVLRFGNQGESIASDIRDSCWIGIDAAIDEFKRRRRRNGGGGLFAGTHVSLLKSPLIQQDIEQNGLHDAVVFDEAGMAAMDEFLLCASLGRRVILFGDHRQLPPFPLPDVVFRELEERRTAIPRTHRMLIERSALEWAATVRNFPVLILQRSYRCQNPRLLRFCSLFFYHALVRPNRDAEYYRLPFAERQEMFPPSTLRLYRTSGLPEALRRERLVLEGTKPGLENRIEARICAFAVFDALRRYSPEEITVITPYRRQVRLIRSCLDAMWKRRTATEKMDRTKWEKFLFDRISTVDRFQGGESDVVIISYVRSNRSDGIGFVEDAQRINVAHTRCRREMVVIADIETLKTQSGNQIFHRMERAFLRDGQILDIDEAFLRENEIAFKPESLTPKTRFETGTS
jgi:superfamily I DNA and/or RNA helicase